MPAGADAATPAGLLFGGIFSDLKEPGDDAVFVLPSRSKVGIEKLPPAASC